ncbi:hypothetical protein M427DRAFT_34974 [Gonapodya prolifera JEL478]|uniref:Sodium/hydrogen exchanger n=1 Tax=Gonapodya prolifera (strain JEL478) TaxID=1344416 RepID=A0A139A695_GONPJ|nr:hypothetical protein M427DRAFT_34974 [Gonapodya prolifera JEL478]|eukprot:KXS12254.1 hypothetical protein M427DRAFT_34974 [Gonapodya prolifera JEL478]
MAETSPADGSSDEPSTILPLPGADTGSKEMYENRTYQLELRAMVMLALVVLAINFAQYMKKKKFHYVSESSVYMIIGFSVALLWTRVIAPLVDGDEDATSGLNKVVQLSSTFFYMVLLPPIVFEGGYNLRRMTFYKNFGTILSLAFVGGLYSTCVICVILYVLGGMVAPNITVTDCLVFGALISSTDPVTVLSLLPSNLDQRVYMLIFGESALNDAVAVILYRFFTNMSDPDMSLGFNSIMWSITSSVLVFFGSVLVGMGLALVYALLTKHAKMPDGPIYESVMFVTFAYASYILSEVLDLTGIIGVFFCGLGMSHYSYNNVNEVTLLSSKVILRVLSIVCEIFIFLYLGMGLVAFGKEQTTYNIPFICICIVALLVGRTHVFWICFAHNLVNTDNPIPLVHQVLMWFSGLRGAVAFALAVQFLEYPSFSLESRHLIFGTGVVVISFTVIVLGGLTPLVLKLLRIGEHSNLHGGDHAAADGEEEYEMLGEMERESSQAELEGSGTVMKWFWWLDSTYLKPFFSSGERHLTFMKEDKRVQDVLHAPSVMQGEDGDGFFRDEESATRSQSLFSPSGRTVTSKALLKTEEGQASVAQIQVGEAENVQKSNNIRKGLTTDKDWLGEESDED